MERYWIPDKELVFAPCTLKSQTDQEATFEGLDNQVLVQPVSKLPEFFKVVDAQLLGVDDIASLEEVHQAAVLHTVRVRFERQLVYTRVARILIAVNPFQALTIYGSAILDKYRTAADSLDQPPHVFGVGHDAIAGLRREGARNQAVLISGESGAGKTETTKLVLSFISEAFGGSGSIQDKIMQTNPVLEAFGNAKTVRNNNSSRFGKWLQVNVSPSLSINSCTVTDYLLELTRVNSQNASERNYHIFFQLLQARQDADMKHLELGEPSSYEYLKKCQHQAQGVDDRQCFDELKDAFEALGFTLEVQQEVFRLIAGILNLGNVDFAEDGEASRVKDEKPLGQAAKQLGVDVEELKKSMVKRRIVVGKDVTEANRTALQASSARDAVARLLYGRLFKWLIQCINVQLSQGGSTEGQFFGVLDIAGFESFEQNSLEQLFINLSNEHLQAHFNNHMFKMELDDYKTEGIDVGSLTFRDNSDIVTLIDSKGGLLALLDEEVTVPKATDQTFLSKVFKAHETHARLVKPKIAGKIPTFGVRHFAGDVMYQSEGFLEKNVDKPPDEAPDLLKSSSMSVLREIGTQISNELSEAGGSRMKKSVKTVSSGFRSSLAELIKKLNSADPHFIRCIKPNAEKVPDKFFSGMVMDQLTCSGVLEAVRIRQSGFAARTPFSDFIGRYRMVVSKSTQAQLPGINDLAERAKVFVDALPSALSAIGGLQDGDLLLGKTKVFARSATISKLDKARDMKLLGYAIDIQCFWRGYVVRKMMKMCDEVFAQLKAWCAKNNFYAEPGSQHTALAKLGSSSAIQAEVDRVQQIFTQSEKLPLPLPRRQAVEKVAQRMQNEVRELEHLQTLAKSLEPVVIEKALARAKDLELPSLAEVDALQMRLGFLKVQLPLAKAMAAALEEQELARLQEVMDAVKATGLHTKTEDWIAELQGMELAGQVYDALEKLKAKKKLDDIEAKRKADLQQQLEEQKHEAKTEATFEEDDKAKRKKTRTTITGLSEGDQQKVLLSLMAACHEYDVQLLEKGLGEATAQGIEECEQLTQAHKLLQNLETEAFLETTLREKQAEIDPREPNAEILRTLQNLINHANERNLATDAVKEAQAVMQQGVRHRTRKTLKGTIFFDKMQLEEMELVDAAFSDLRTFTGIKETTQWRGHRTGRYFGAAENLNETMLRHTKLELKAALTRVQAGEEKKAIQCFRCLLGWMGDRPVPACQRTGQLQDLIDTAKMSPSLADEVYVQTMKQLTENPSVRSAVQGWKVLLRLCQDVKSSEQLEEFLRNFLMRSAARDCSMQEDAEIAATAKQCVIDLNINSASEEKIRTSVGGVGSGAQVMPVTILLVDHSTRKVHIERSATLEQLSQRLCEQLRVTQTEEFGFFQMTDGLESHRLLPQTLVLSAVEEKWSKLKASSGRASHLLFKRKFLKVNEMLNPGDLGHATLTYKQVLWDYLHYPAPEDNTFISAIAASILLLEIDHYSEYVNKRRIDDPAILEQLVPAVSLRDRQYKRWSNQIMNLLAQLRESVEPGESRLLGMSRVMSLCQRMKLFGAYFWHGRQVNSIEPEQAAIKEAPRRNCAINAKSLENEYWICVDLFGVRFVSVDTQPGSNFQRGFLFAEEAVERVYCCAAQNTVVQFVVKTVDPKDPTAGRIPQTITIMSPAAVDVAFIVNVVLKQHYTTPTGQSRRSQK
eukprot:TRINITY_DN26242_c0_g1_i1.p1 TRINITY_DN26242_c0_g1~~TRINITY_DN26242_c0_g1_i1.p1  ORF type:complete len:1684 (-),score=375.50 TRINITY_DN26242_c0_g1_i1:457-5508(-)